MHRHKLALTIFAVFVAVTLACSRQASTPTSPSGPAPVAADAAADGSTLKSTAPVPISPVNGVQVSDQQPTLTVSPATTKVAAGGLRYEFAVFNDANAKVAGGVVGGTSFTVPTALDFGKEAHLAGARDVAGREWSLVDACTVCLGRRRASAGTKFAIR